MASPIVDEFDKDCTGCRYESGGVCLAWGGIAITLLAWGWL